MQSANVGECDLVASFLAEILAKTLAKSLARTLRGSQAGRFFAQTFGLILAKT